VLDTLGRAINGAQVAVSGERRVSGITGQYGEFTLNALPSGTRELIVPAHRVLPVYMAVELTVREPRVVTVQMEKAVPQLAPCVSKPRSRPISRNRLSRSQEDVGLWPFPRT